MTLVDKTLLVLLSKNKNPSNTLAYQVALRQPPFPKKNPKTKTKKQKTPTKPTKQTKTPQKNKHKKPLNTTIQNPKKQKKKNPKTKPKKTQKQSLQGFTYQKMYRLTSLKLFLCLNYVYAFSCWAKPNTSRMQHALPSITELV